MAAIKLILSFMLVAQASSWHASPLKVDERATAVCGSGIYGELVPILGPYNMAQAHCSNVYPLACKTEATRDLDYRTIRPFATIEPPCTTATKPTSIEQKITITSTGDATMLAWSQCRKRPASIISALCSCIGAPTVQTSSHKHTHN
jgi:hypothetical protein